MLRSAVVSNKPHCSGNIVDITTRLRRAAGLLALLFSILTVQAQTRRGDEINLNRLEQAVAAISAGKLSQAEALLNSVLAVSPREADALNLLGVVRARQQRPAEAEKLFRGALAASPMHLGAHLNLGELLLTTDRPQQALPVLLGAHKLAPERPDINLNLAMLYGRRGEHGRALEHLSLIPRPSASEEFYSTLLTTLLALNRVEEARKLAREFRELGVGGPDARARFALLLAGGSLNEEALDLLEDARRQTPDSFPILYALGVINGAAKRYDEAEEYLAGALRVMPDDVRTLRAAARVARAKGNIEKSLAHLIHARRIAPESPGVLYDFGATALEMGLLLDALPAFEQLHRLRPREPAYVYALAAARFRKGELTESARLMRSYVAARPRDAAGFYLLGAALHRLGQFAEARTALERSLRLKPDPDAEYLLGLTLDSEGNRAAAIAALRRVVGQRPDHAAAHAALGAAFREQGLYTEARVELERAVELDPGDLRASYQLGLVYAKLGDKEGAKKMFARADELRGRERQRESVILKLIEPPSN